MSRLEDLENIVDTISALISEVESTEFKDLLNEDLEYYAQERENEERIKNLEDDKLRAEQNREWQNMRI